MLDASVVLANPCPRFTFMRRLLQQAGFLAALLLAMHTGAAPDFSTHPSAGRDHQHDAAPDPAGLASVQQLAQLATDGEAAGNETSATAAGGSLHVPLDTLADISLQDSGGPELPQG